MWTLVAELLLLCHFSLMFSLSVLSLVLYLRTRDGVIWDLSRALYPLFFHAFASMYSYLFSGRLAQLVPNAVPGVNLFFLFVAVVTVPAVFYGISTYTLGLLNLSDRVRRASRVGVVVLSAAFFLLSIYSILFVHGDDWSGALSGAINELFLFGSIYLSVPAIAAAWVFRSRVDSTTRRLIRVVTVPFLAVAPLGVVDLLFLRTSPYKTVYVSYLVFAIMVYLNTARHYVNTYDSDADLVPGSNAPVYGDLGLSDREREIIPYLVEGKSNSVISEALFISPNTVKTHVRHIFRKAGVSNRLQLLAALRRHPEG